MAPHLSGMMNALPFDNTYARLPARFFAHVAPTPVGSPRLIRLNAALAADLGLDPAWLAGSDGVAMLSGTRMPEGAEPLAAAYAGHQFGQFVPQLGDGRAVLLGEVVGRDGRRDIQLKGSGPTPFSRQGDGRAALGPVLREYVVSEAMAALGIPTTRALAAVATGEFVARETVLPGAVLTRVAASHIRVGTFQYFAARRDAEGLAALAAHAIARHYPEAAQAPVPARALLEGVIAAQAALVARWLCVGFVHGVMNTDNMSVAGETIDYGPCAFLDAYEPGRSYSAIDQQSRYAYANQPRIALWNLTRLAETLLPLLDPDETKAVAVAEEALAGFAARFEAAYDGGLARKLGIAVPREGDRALASDLLQAMAEGGADFTLSFRALCELEGADAEDDAAFAALSTKPEGLRAWLPRWRARLAQARDDAPARRDLMRGENPAYLPRNHRVEAVIAAAVEQDDFAPFQELVEVLARPYDDQPALIAYAASPKLEERVMRTFCGT